MKKNKFNKFIILSVLILLGHFCFGQFSIDDPFPVVQLNKDSTHIVLEDYFPNVKETAYRITHEPAGMDVRIYNNYEIILYGEPTDVMDYLGVSVNFIERGIPLKKYIEQNEVFEDKNFITTQSFKEDKKLEIYRSYPATRLLAFINNRPIDQTYFSFQGQKVLMTIPEYVANFSNANLRIYGYDFKQTTNDVWVPLSYGEPIENAEVLTQTDYHSNIIYSLMIDRFKNGDRSNDSPLNIPEVTQEMDWQGGDLKGIAEILDKDYFSQMGYNALIISPIFKNANELETSSNEYIIPYHGRWPISWSKIEPRFGIDEDFQRIIGKAHLKKMNIFLGNIVRDFTPENQLVSNHYEWQLKDTPKSIFNQNNPSISLDLDKPEVSKIIIDSLTNVFDVYPIDGFAHLDTDFISNKFWFKLSNNINRKIAIPQRRKLFQLGQSSIDKASLGNQKLNSQFDLEFAELMRSVFLKGNDIQQLNNFMNSRINEFGSHHLLANITGNEYNPRARSIVENAKENNFELNNPSNIVWDKLKQYFVFNTTIPGIPVTFYGDEIGMIGEGKKAHGIMRFSGLNNDETNFRNFVAGLNKLRRSNMALMYGETEVLKSSKNTLIYGRSYLNNKVIIAFNTSNHPQSYEVDLPDYMKDQYFRGTYFTPVEKLYRKLLFTLPANGFEIFISK